MADVNPEIRKDAETGHLDAMKNALAAIPPEEHLKIIQGLRAAEQGNPNLTVDINPNSTANNYEYSVTYKGAGSGGVTVPENMVATMAQAMGVSVAEEKRQLAAAQGSAGNSLTLHELYIDDGTSKVHRLSADKKL